MDLDELRATLERELGIDLSAPSESGVNWMDDDILPRIIDAATGEPVDIKPQGKGVTVIPDAFDEAP